MPHKGLGNLGMETHEFELALSLTQAQAEAANDAEGDGVDTDLQSTLQALMREAIDHYEENVEPDQADATDYYFARRPKGAGKGRSSVVSTDVRDTVLDRVPDILEVFMGSDSVVEFQPTGPEDEPVAAQMTDYVNHLFYEKNPGFLTLNSVVKDAEVRRLVYTKWWWEETPRVEGETHRGIIEEELLILSEDEDVDDYEILREYEGLAPTQDPGTGQMVMAPAVLYDCEVTRTIKGGRLRAAALPPEEVVWTPFARGFDDTAQIIAHVREVPQDELIRLGIPESLISQSVGRREARSAGSSLEQARQFWGVSNRSTARRDRDDTADESQDPVVFAEAYALLDTDGDGVAELRMFQLVGPDHTINPEKPKGELVSHVPIAYFTPEPEPHTIPGLCTYDHTKQVQDVKSDVQRAQLNSLAQAVEPQIAVLDRMVNLSDLLSPEVTSIIRVKGTAIGDSIREIKTQFVAAETLDVLAYYDTIKGERSGQAGPREGLDPNVLQSTTREAVSSNLTKGQRRIMMTARAYAEIGMAQMFRGILMTVIENQNKSEVVRLRNQWVEVDPRSWHADRDVKINVALGTGSKRERIETLMALAEKQEMHIAQDSPLGSFALLRNTYGKLTDLMGYRDTNQFWPQFGPAEEQQMQEAQAQQQQPDPAMLIAQAEQAKVQAEIQLDQMKLELEQWKAQQENDRARDKLAQEAVLKEREIEAKHNVDIVDAELKAQVASRRAELDADVKREAVQVQAAAQRQQQAQQETT